MALTLGDNQYETGALADFRTGYGTTWGAFLSRTRPAVGNHEYKSSSTAAGYFGYFGGRAPDNYYSFNVGAWHLISLDSNCAFAGGCGAGSRQYEWLKADLAAHPTRCTLAYFHHPRWSSGTAHGNSSQVGPFIDLLYNAGAEVVLSGHEHNYERYASADARRARSTRSVASCSSSSAPAGTASIPWDPRTPTAARGTRPATAS